MRRTKQEPVIPQSKELKSTPNGVAIKQVAEAITGNVVEGMDSGSLDTIEATGQLSMSVLLTMLNEGLLNDNQAVSFLREMASRKTQAPVQRVEQHVKMDLRAVFNDIAESNPVIRDTRIKQAKVWDGEVREKLQLDDDMMLKPRDENEAEEGRSGSSAEATFTLGAPPEIEDIRQGGDGSEKRQSWERQGAKVPTYRSKGE